ncbi:hypothetical protein T08_4201 [Trichinella sp. T8]|nr:hypothetical protein T08_4201 [Trichinella sp. T8]
MHDFTHMPLSNILRVSRHITYVGKENTLHSEFEAAITAIRLVLSITEYSDDINMDIKKYGVSYLLLR